MSHYRATPLGMCDCDAKALREAIDQLWWPRLKAIRLLIAKCRASGWQKESIWAFTWRLFSGPSTTKTSQEDILQELTNAARANRRKDINLPRAMFVAAESKRLDGLPCARLRLGRGDLAAYGSAHQVTVQDFKPRKERAESSIPSTAVDQAIQHLKDSTQRSQPDQDAWQLIGMPVYLCLSWSSQSMNHVGFKLK